MFNVTPDTFWGRFFTGYTVQPHSAKTLKADRMAG